MLFKSYFIQKNMLTIFSNQITNTTMTVTDIISDIEHKQIYHNQMNKATVTPFP